MEDLAAIKRELSAAKIHFNPLLKSIVNAYKTISIAIEITNEQSNYSIKEIYVNANIEDKSDAFCGNSNDLEIICEIDGEEKVLSRKLNTDFPFSPFDVILTCYLIDPTIIGNTLIAARNDGYREINISDILFIKAHNNKSFFFLETAEVIYSDASLGEYVKIFESNSDFERVQNSYIVNKSKVIGMVNGMKLLLNVPVGLDTKKIDEIFMEISTTIPSRLPKKSIETTNLNNLEKLQFKIPVGKDAIKGIEKRILNSRHK